VAFLRKRISVIPTEAQVFTGEEGTNGFIPSAYNAAILRWGEDGGPSAKPQDVWHKSKKKGG
jgi:hypothetical protein